MPMTGTRALGYSPALTSLFDRRNLAHNMQTLRYERTSRTNRHASQLRSMQQGNRARGGHDPGGPGLRLILLQL
jgi:hypothetical protein